MYGHYNKGMPLKKRAFLYAIFGEKIMKKSVLGTAVDSFSIIAVAAGTKGTSGSLGLEAGYGVSSITNVSKCISINIIIIILLVIGAAISAVTVIHKGIQFLSSFNVILAVGLIIGVLILGPGLFIFNNYFEAFGLYINDFLSFNTYRSDEAWLGMWT